MKVRDIYWFRTESERTSKARFVVWSYYTGKRWLVYDFVCPGLLHSVENRENFEQLYLKWKSENED